MRGDRLWPEALPPEANGPSGSGTLIFDASRIQTISLSTNNMTETVSASGRRLCTPDQAPRALRAPTFNPGGHKHRVPMIALMAMSP
jgi:hypothetical protein